MLAVLIASLGGLAQADVPPQDKQQPSLAATGYDDGFFLRSADGENELVIGGLFQFGANVFDDHREPSADFDVRRMRLEVGARIAGALRVFLEPNFLPEGTEMEEAWIGLDMLRDDARLMFGRAKAPFGLEEVRSRRPIDFPRFSILNQFSPAEDQGIFLKGDSESRMWEYGLAAYNGTGGSDTTSSKDVAARAVWHPFADEPGTTFENLQLGLAGTIGSQDEDVGGTTIDNELGLSVLEFDAGTRLDGLRLRAGLEFAWFQGPWFLQAEYAHIQQEMESGATSDDVAFQGAYVSIARVLTGESKTFRGVNPTRPWNPVNGEGRGAWVLAARWSELDLDSDLDNSPLTVPGTFTDRIRTFSIGLNWIANRHLTVRNAFIETLYSDEVELDDGSTDHEEAIMVELQLSF